MIIKTYYLYCTQCGKEYDEPEENIKDLRKFAKCNGWIYKRVENGSHWDFCPNCAKDIVKQRIYGH